MGFLAAEPVENVLDKLVAPEENSVEVTDRDRTADDVPQRVREIESAGAKEVLQSLTDAVEPTTVPKKEEPPVVQDVETEQAKKSILEELSGPAEEDKNSDDDKPDEQQRGEQQDA
jgi:hypothetical protein